MTDIESLDEVMTAWVDGTQDALPRVHEMLGVAPREEVFDSLIELGLRLEHLRTAHLAAGALLALADAQAELAKTESNFEEYAESTAEENQRLRNEVARLNALVSEMTS